MAAAKEMVEMKFPLRNGIHMPAIGLGTFRITNDEEMFNAVDAALDCGYRLFDTATVYKNDIVMKKAFDVLLPKYGLERDDIFITTKLAPAQMGNFDTVNAALDETMRNLGVDYIDLFLIHFPGSQRLPGQDKRNMDKRLSSWDALKKLYENGKVNGIGVSNYTIRHLMEMKPSNFMPFVNQVEWHPYYFQRDLYDYCQMHDIIIQAYCPFGGASVHDLQLLQEPVIGNIAMKYGGTPAQVLLLWSLQQKVAVVPKAVGEDHIKENISMEFRLTPEEIKAINDLGVKRIKYAWDPNPIV